MRYKWMAPVLLAGALTIGACGGSTDDAATDDDTEEGGGGGGGGDAAAGKELFNGTCASCHGTDGKDPSVGKDITASAWIADATDAEVIALITNGRSTSDPENTTGVDMPVKGGNPSLTEENIADIAAYVRSINNG